MALALMASLAAQGRHWIVDANNGTGAHFTNLPPAVAAAQPGDVIAVRPGTYRSFATQKGIAVVGLGTAPSDVTIVDGTVFPFGTPLVSVSWLPPAAEFKLSNLRLAFSGTQRGLELVDNAGSVFVSDCEMVFPTCRDCGAPGYPGATVVRSARVTFTECRIEGSPSLDVDRSSAVVVGSTMHAGGFSLPPVPCCTTPGIRAVSSTLTLARSTVVGSPAYDYFTAYVRPGVGVAITGGELHLRGNAHDGVFAGPNLISTRPLLPTPAISAYSTRLELDPIVTLAATDGAPTIVCTNCPLTSRRRLALSATDGRIGGGLAGDFVSRGGDPFVVLADVPRPPQSTPFGELHVDPARSISSVLLLQDPRELTRFVIPVPAVPDLLGNSIALQAVGLDSGLLQPDLSNPAVVALR